MAADGDDVVALAGNNWVWSGDLLGCAHNAGVVRWTSGRWSLGARARRGLLCTVAENSVGRNDTAGHDVHGVDVDGAVTTSNVGLGTEDGELGSDVLG